MMSVNLLANLIDIFWILSQTVKQNTSKRVISSVKANQWQSIKRRLKIGKWSSHHQLRDSQQSIMLLSSYLSKVNWLSSLYGLSWQQYQPMLSHKCRQILSLQTCFLLEPWHMNTSELTLNTSRLASQLQFILKMQKLTMHQRKYS